MFGQRLENLEEYTPYPYTEGCVRLDANESFINFPDEIKQEIIKKITEEALNRYPDPNAAELCAEFADLYRLKPENVVAGNGSDELIALIFSALLNAGSNVLVTAPDFSMYKFYCELYGQNVTVLQKDENFAFTADMIIKKAAETNSDFIIFSNPCNPTGQGLSAKEAEKIISSVNCTVCVDEAYMEFWADNETVLDLIEKHDNLLVLKTCSKAFGCASMRLGFAAAGKKIISMFKKAKSPYNVNSLSQAAGTVILKNKEILEAATKQIIKQKNELYTELKKLERRDFSVFETKTNFVLCQSSKAELIYKNLEKENIIIRYLRPDLLRITAGSYEENTAFLKKTEVILNETGIC